MSTKEDSLEIFNLILQSDKIDIESKNYRGNTILHNACKSYFDRYFFSLIEKTKPNVNAVNEIGQTPIYLCFNSKRFKKLIELGADLSIIGKQNFPFYTAAAYQSATDILEECFSNKDLDLTMVADDGMTLLHCLPDKNISIENYIQNENIRDLFRKCTNSVAKYDNETPVFAASKKSLKLLKLMFEYGNPDLNHRNVNGETAAFGTYRYI